MTGVVGVLIYPAAARLHRITPQSFGECARLRQCCYSYPSAVLQCISAGRLDLVSTGARTPQVLLLQLADDNSTVAGAAPVVHRRMIWQLP